EPAEKFASVDAQRGRPENGGRARLRRLERERAMWPVPVEVVDVVPESPYDLRRGRIVYRYP
ncbi:MAG TPA: hypothetical protein VMU58_04895, partial [Gaiellaceae bacterium]|nr:hypothetical protein [Gaiellaceae bacterium]